MSPKHISFATGINTTNVNVITNNMDINNNNIITNYTIDSNNNIIDGSNTSDENNECITIIIIILCALGLCALTIYIFKQYASMQSII